jgi:hypothetical protein
MSANYFVPGAGSSQWGSGQSNTSNNGSTTTKYFDPQAIIDQLNKNAAKSGQNSAEHNFLMGGAGYNPGAAAAPYAAPAAGTPAAPAAVVPVRHTTGVTPAPGGGVEMAAPPLGGTPRTPAPPTGAAAPSPGGAGPRNGTPFQPNAPAVTPLAHGETPAGAMNVEYQAPVSGDPNQPGAVGGGAPVPGTPSPSGDPGLPGAPGTPATPPTDGSDPNASQGGLMGLLTQLMSGQGYSDAEKNAINENAAGTLAAQKASSQAQMADHLASSGNAAGYGGAMSALDTGAAKTASDQARQNQIDFANEVERRKELGGSVSESLLGINTAADTALNAQNSGLASLGGGQDTSQNGSSGFNNQNYQATPDASAGTKTPSSGSGSGASGSKGGTTGTPGAAGPLPGSTYDKNGDLVDKDGNYINPDGSPGAPPSDRDANGNRPGDPGYDPTTDPNSPDYAPSGPPEPTGPPDPGVLPDPTGGAPSDPTIQPDPTQGDPTGGGDSTGGGSLQDLLTRLRFS